MGVGEHADADVEEVHVGMLADMVTRRLRGYG
jgi:hypothetical protein